MARGKRGSGARKNRSKTKSTKSSKSSSSSGGGGKSGGGKSGGGKSGGGKSSGGSKNKRGSGAKNNRSTTSTSTKSTSTKSTSTKSTSTSTSNKGGSGGRNNPSSNKNTNAGRQAAAKTAATKTTTTTQTKSPTNNKQTKSPTKTVSTKTKQGKDKTPAQIAASKRIAEGKTVSDVKTANKEAMKVAAKERDTKFKQTKVQTFGGKKTNFTEAEEKRITDAGYKVAGYSKAPAKSDTQLQVDKDTAQYGNTVPSGSFGISEEGKALAAQQKAEAAAKKEAERKAAAAAAEKARKAEEKRQVQFDPSRLLGGTIAQTGAAVADKVAKPTVMYQGNFAGRLPGISNYFSPDAGAAATYSRSGALKGVPFAGGSPTGTLTKFNVPAGAQLGRSPLGIRQFKLTPSQMSQLGKGVTVAGDDAAKLAAKGLGKYGARAVPFAGAALSLADAGMRIRDKDYTGAALAAASAIPGPVGLAALGGLAFKDVRAAMNAPQQVASTQAGGLNIGGGVDSGEAPSNTARAITNKATFGDRLKQSIGAFGTLNQNMSDLSGQSTGPINTAKNLVKSLAVGGKDLSMEDMAASTSFAKAFKDKPLDAVANLNPDGSRRVIKTLSTLNKNKDVSEALANYGGEGFQKGLRDTASLVSDNYDKLSTDAKGNRKVVSDMLMGNDPRAEFGKRLAFQQKENPQLSMQSKIKYASDPNFKQYTGTDRQGNKVFENKIKGINRKEMGIVGSLGNLVLSNQGRDVVTGNLPGTNNALDLASNIINTGRDPKSSTYKASQGFLKTIGAGGQPTPGSIIRGINPFRGSDRGGGTTTTTPTFQSVGTGGGGDTPVGQVPQIPATGTVPQFQVPELPVQQGTDPSNLANIQNESYQSTFKNLMAINPNYSARFQMRRRRGGRRGSFKRAFSRRFFR